MIDNEEKIYNLTLSDLRNLNKNILGVNDLVEKYEDKLPTDFVEKIFNLLHLSVKNIINIKEYRGN